MYAGGLLGLVGTTPNLNLFVLALTGATSFLIVILVGAIVVRKNAPAGRLGGVALLSALIGGLASVGVIWYAGASSSFAERAVALGFLGVLGMVLSLMGAAVARQEGEELAGGRFLDRNRFSATLVCGGAALGLVGSAPSGFTLISGFLGLICFGLVLLFGVRLFQKRPEARILSAATIYFALVGGVVDIVFPPFGLVIYGGALWLISVGPIGTVTAITGAVLRLRRVPT